MSPRKAKSVDDDIVKQVPDEPEVAPEPMPAAVKPPKAKPVDPDDAWQEKCPACECYDLQWYPVTMVPKVGETAMRRCRQCRQSRVVKRIR